MSSTAGVGNWAEVVSAAGSDAQAVSDASNVSVGQGPPPAARLDVLPRANAAERNHIDDSA